VKKTKSTNYETTIQEIGKNKNKEDEQIVDKINEKTILKSKKKIKYKKLT